MHSQAVQISLQLKFNSTFIFVSTGYFETKPHIWREFASHGFWTLFGEDWELTKWAYKHPLGKSFDYNHHNIGRAVAKSFPKQMKRFVLHDGANFIYRNFTNLILNSDKLKRFVFINTQLTTLASNFISKVWMG